MGLRQGESQYASRHRDAGCDATSQTLTTPHCRFLRGPLRRQRLSSVAMRSARIGMTRQTANAVEAGKFAPSMDVAFPIVIGSR